MSKICGFKKGDVIRVKFIDMRDIVKKKSKNKSYNLISEWELGANILAFTYGGDFLVKEDAPPSGKDQVLEVLNHLDGGSFDIPEEIVDSIQLLDVSNKFVSEDHHLSLTQIDDTIYINGERLENTDEDKHLDNFITFIEKYLMQRAIENSIKGK
jgi:hypothetical protein